ncbi:MAG: cold shock and DUF1294 domain-containing protein [Polaromonas sp.]|uniref:cold shock and DUF1294 domain-containing protein n=1 Tax=Polaromonas sp. TaxID=1869339 RepID=UPI00271F6330|nr:cold shock and DUF1294 domain-containing protein [Polaromonas sp.]MDO9114049.1 cold shock and DUF1294 domain-containing protein [Polaromonas sp.]MDP1885783.1 cold shock and DUF1294 domain-containing protein [Polaromonas sp.]
MRKQGTVARWDATRGFGFIRSPASGADLFFHKQDFRGTHPPREGLAVSFEEVHVGGKGPRALAVQTTDHNGRAPGLSSSASRARQPAPPAGRRTSTAHSRPQQHPRHSRAPSPSAPAGPLWLLLPSWGALLAWGVWTGRLPLLVLPAALLLNLVTFFVYWLDKYAAQQGRWRTAENTLHLFSLLGGWPGAWFAQQLLRHKSSKASFRASYWASVAVHFIALAAWMGRESLQRMLLNM